MRKEKERNSKERNGATPTKRASRRTLEALITEFFQSHPDRVYKLKSIFHELGLKTHPMKMFALEILEDMVWDDFLTKKSDIEYRLSHGGQVQEGRFVRKSNGRNSFIADGSDTPVFVAERNSMFALNGDRVKVTLFARRQNRIREAQVIEIISRARDTIVGTLRIGHDFAFLLPEENVYAADVIVPKNKLKGARNGDKVVVKIIEWASSENRSYIAQVFDVLGKSGDNNVEMNTILAKYNLPYRYPERVEAEAEKFSGEITPQDEAEREDFRGVFTCTIDPKDAKDFDDALSIQRTKGGLWQVGIHIADVSHYVEEGSIIDREAEKRATSIYLVDRTIPMLPERLCNFICSLRPDEDKLTYSVVVDMDDNGNVKSSRIVHTIIRSQRRYAYEEVQELLERNGVIDGSGNPAPPAPATGYVGEHADELIQLDRLAKLLREKRMKNGAVRFDREELRFDIDDKGKPISCYYKRSKDANKLIEEFMLLANRIVAESVGKVKKGVKAKTFPYRVHDNPDPQKLETLRNFVVKFGYKLKTAGTRGEMARSLNNLIDSCEGKREQNLVQQVALRAMMKAYYTVHNIGHFGLAFDYYTHFTSPIRRYPDTIVHRLLTRYQQGAKSANARHIEDLCKHSSDMEVLAQTAERDSIKYKMVEFMSDKVGNVYDAHISGITTHCIFCEIDENHCEGAIELHDLSDDYYDFDDRNYCLVGRRHQYCYQLGDPIRIRVAGANVDKRQLDFVPEED